jgi:hypothetical protein
LSGHERRLEDGGEPYEWDSDIIVSTLEECAWRKDVVGTIEHPAAHDGKVLYERR